MLHFKAVCTKFGKLGSQIVFKCSSKLFIFCFVHFWITKYYVYQQKQALRALLKITSIQILYSAIILIERKKLLISSNLYMI